MTRAKILPGAAVLLGGLLLAATGRAQLTVTIKDINPNQSNSSDPDGASGGRVNHVRVDPSNGARLFAASEWGGLFRSADGGSTWSHLDGHVPTATWDVRVDPSNPNKVYATSFYDGRVNSESGINVSSDGGNTWTHPASATPPTGFCTTTTRRTELAAFGISIDPANPSHVFIGTNCGLAISLDSGATWTFVDPTPTTKANDVNDVVVHDGGIIDLCGDDGHLRSTNGGSTWTSATSQPLPAGLCSLAVSPDESYVLFAVVGTSIFESDDGGQSWPVTYTNRSPQGRIPFVATNKRTAPNYDLWFGDVSLFRGTCTTPSPAGPGGSQRCTASSAWAGGFTRSNGAHDDSGSIAFAPGVATNACPIFFSSDGGVFRNTLTSSPGCHTPVWTQPNVTPHALWDFTFEGVHRAGAVPEDLYMGNQDNGAFGAPNGGAASVTWNNPICCDGFDSGGESTRGMATICCFGGRATRLFLGSAGLTGLAEINTYPGGNMRSFEQLEAIVNIGTNAYAIATSTGVFVTSDIGASPVSWTQLGSSTSPASPCGLEQSVNGGATTLFVKSGGCNGDSQGLMFRYQGTAPGGIWQQIPTPGIGSFGIFAVDPNNPNRMIASHLGGPTGPEMIMSLNGGATWDRLVALDQLMTGHGAFQYSNRTGPSPFTGFFGYPQPTLVAFDPSDPDIVVAGGADSGVFISTNGGTQWQLVTDPFTPGASGVAHIPRPFYAHFDHDPPGGDINLFLGTRGRGAWRLTFKKAPMPQIQVSAPPTFPRTCLGDKQAGTLKICNTGLSDLLVLSITSSNPEFTIDSPSSGFPVTISHDFCFPFTVIFRPLAAGVRTTTLTIVSNDPSLPTLTIPVSAQAGVGAIGTTSTLLFDPTVIQSIGKCHTARPLVISNTGSCDVPVTDVALSGTNAGEYSLSGLPSFPVSIEPGHEVGEGDLKAVFAPTAVARERTAQATVTFVSNPATGATSTQTIALCGEGVRTGARVLVTHGGVPLPDVHEIELKRLDATIGGIPKEVDEQGHVMLQTVTPTAGSGCASYQFHREWGGASNPRQLVPGVYQLKVEAVINGKEDERKMWFQVETCGFDGTIVVDF